MITLNLIPPADKRELRLLRVFLAVKNLVTLALIGVIAIATGLIFTRTFLQNYYSHLTAATTKMYAGVSRFPSSEIRTLQQELSSTRTIQAAFIPWSQLLLRITAQIKPGITLTDLRVVSGGQGEISGVAQTREDLLRLRDQLVNSGVTQEFEIPLATKLQRVNILFRFPVQFIVTPPVPPKHE